MKHYFLLLNINFRFRFSISKSTFRHIFNMVSLLVVQIIKYRFGVPVVAMLGRINVMSRCTVNYVMAEQMV